LTCKLLIVRTRHYV